jgi:protein TonB
VVPFWLGELEIPSGVPPSRITFRLVPIKNLINFRSYMFRKLGTPTLLICAVLVFGKTGSSQTKITAKANAFGSQPHATVTESDRIKDGLAGPVRRVRTEIVKLTNENGKLVEGKRAVLEIVAYDIRGTKIENQYFPVAGGTLTGKEVYKYDDKGNISEMTLVNEDGTLVSRETYKYEFDFAGNWNKMTTSVAVIEAGKVTFEPTEVTYRSIMYYLDENMAKMLQPAAQPSVSSASPRSAVDTKMTVSESAQKNTTSDRKTAPSLPTASATNDLNAVNSAAVKTISSTADTKSPQVVLDSEPPPAPGPKPLLKPVSGGVLNGTAINLPAPLYPETAKRMRVSGVVVVDVVVDETGKVISAEASSGPSTLRDAAVQAALRARFSPTKLSGQPVKVSGVINYKFSLSQ